MSEVMNVGVMNVGQSWGVRVRGARQCAGGKYRSRVEKK